MGRLFLPLYSYKEYKWDALSSRGWFVDYQNMYTFLGVMSQRQLFLTASNAMVDASEGLKAKELLDMCGECFPEENFPLETICLGFAGNDYMVAQMIENYYYLAQSGLLPEEAEEEALSSARALTGRFGASLMESAAFYLGWGSYGSAELETIGRVILYVADVCKQYGDTALSEELSGGFEDLIKN